MPHMCIYDKKPSKKSIVVYRLEKQKLAALTGAAVDDEAGDVDEMSESEHEEEDDSAGQPTHQKGKEG